MTDRPTEVSKTAPAVGPINIPTSRSKIKYLLASIRNFLEKYFMFYKDFIVIGNFSEKENNPAKEISKIGMSIHHFMIYNMLRFTYTKLKPKLKKL